MARRRVYTGTLAHHHRQTAKMAQSHSSEHSCTTKSVSHLAHLVSRYIWAGYNVMNGNYIALVTVLAVVLFSFLIPDISHKIRATSELKSMKKVVNMMTNEVKRAEVACLTATDDVCYLKCSMQDGATETLAHLQDTSTCTSQCARSTTSEPIRVEGQIGLFRRLFFPDRNTSLQEIAIKSYVYTDSFNA